MPRRPTRSRRKLSRPPLLRARAQLADQVRDLTLLVADLKQRVSLFELEKRHRESALGRAERGLPTEDEPRVAVDPWVRESVRRISDAAFNRLRRDKRAEEAAVSPEGPAAEAATDLGPCPERHPSGDGHPCLRVEGHEGAHRDILRREWGGRGDYGEPVRAVDKTVAWRTAVVQFALDADDEMRRRIIDAWEGDRAKLCGEPPPMTNQCALGRDHRGDHVSVDGFKWHKWAGE